MKKIILFFSFVTIIYSAKAQYVTIPDANFVTFLQTNFPTCMSGNQMDTTCAAIQNDTSLILNSLSIANLTGVKYFINLLTLKCMSNSLTSLPTLPNTLKRLICSNNHIASISGLPNGLLTLDCSSNYYYLTNIVSLPITLQTLLCRSNAITSLPTLPNSISYLDCNGTQITSLPTLPNSLIYMECGGTQITSLPTLPNSLKKLYCEVCYHLTSIGAFALPFQLQQFDCFGDSLSVLPFLPSSLLNLHCCCNHLTYLPALPNGLVQLSCDNNQITSLPTLPNTLQWLRTDNNPLGSLPSTLPTSLTYLECRDNLLTSLPVLPSALTSLDCGNNALISLPVLPSGLGTLTCDNCQLTSLSALPIALSILICNNNFLTSLPALNYNIYKLKVNNNNINCFPTFPNIPSIYASDFNISGNPFTCLPNYIPAMNAATLAYPLCVTGDLINNPYGCASANGVTGNTYKDTVVNCIYNAGSDIGKNNINLKQYDGASNLRQQMYSFTNGKYYFINTPGAYRVAVDTTGVPYTDQCVVPSVGTNVTLTAGSPLAQNIDFDIICKPGFDVGAQSVVSSGIVRPNVQHVLNVMAGDMSHWYGLNCAAGVSGQVQVTVTGPVTYVSPAFGALTPSVAGNVFTYTVANFGLINNSTAFNLLLLTNPTAVAGDTICVNVTVTPSAGDNNASNNSYNFCYHVVNSYDPNEKESYPVDVVYGYDDYFTYTIHFQNTGTAPAINIRVVDTLDANLDMSTFQEINQSAKNVTYINGNSVWFNFANINLPDSTTNSAGSKGFVQYRIKPVAGLPCGTQLFNHANIYFDNNTPIVTNTTINNVGIGLGTSASISPVACDNYMINSQTYTTSGVYTQNFTNSEGCDSTLIINLSLQSNSNSISQVACGNYTLNSQTYTASGVYTQNLTNVSGCDSTLIVNLTINPIDTSVTQSGLSLTANQSSASYQWLDCTTSNSPIIGATNQSYMVISNGQYAVVIYYGVCVDTSACYSFTNVGIAENNLEDGISISPNPFSFETTITFSEPQKNTTIKITDVLGKEIKTIHCIGKQCVIEKGEMEAGIYFVEIMNENKNTINKKMIVQ